MTKKELEQLAGKYQQKADRAYRKHQDTGLRRYAREHKQNQELTDAMNMAADAAADHRELINLRSQVAALAAKAKDIPTLPKEKKPLALEKLRRQLLSFARLWGISE